MVDTRFNACVAAAAAVTAAVCSSPNAKASNDGIVGLFEQLLDAAIERAKK